MAVWTSFADERILQKGTPLIPATLPKHLELQGEDKKQASIEILEVNNPEFLQAIQISNHKVSVNFWNVKLGFPVELEGSAGDTMFLRLYCRSISSKDESGKGRIKVLYRSLPRPAKISLEKTLSANKGWTKYDIPFALKKTQKRGELYFAFSLANQTVQIAGIQLIYFGKNTALNKLPKTRFTYEGREANAPWRKTANARIEKYRKSGTTLKVVDKNGNPVSGAKIKIAMKRHAFPFGTCIYSAIMLNIRSWWKPYSQDDRKKYLKILKQNFNTVSPGNSLKMPAWTGVFKDKSYTPENTKRLVEMLKENHFEICAHSLVWPGWNHLKAPGIEKLKKNPDALEKFILNHIKDIVPAFKGKIKDWIVVNEPRQNHDVMDLCGKQVMVDWFKEAHRLDPKAKLYLNDYAILNQEGSLNNLEAAAYEKTVAYLKQKNAPLHGIGFQAHFTSDLTPPEQVYKILDRLGKTGLEMQVTEFDIDTDDEQLQADYTRDFLTIVFSHPQIVGFTMWGFWAGDHWRPFGAMYDKNWREKPNATAYKNLVLEKWWTRCSGKTNRKGEFSFRGFLGDYEAIIEVKNKKNIVPFSLEKSKEITELRIK